MVAADWRLLAMLVAALMAAKALGIYVVARLFKADNRESIRRAALFAEIEHLGLQAFMTGTEPALFAALEGRAQMVRVLPGALES